MTYEPGCRFGIFVTCDKAFFCLYQIVLKLCDLGLKLVPAKIAAKTASKIIAYECSKLTKTRIKDKSMITSNRYSRIYNSGNKRMLRQKQAAKGVAFNPTHPVALPLELPQ